MVAGKRRNDVGVVWLCRHGMMFVLPLEGRQVWKVMPFRGLRKIGTLSSDSVRSRFGNDIFDIPILRSLSGETEWQNRKDRLE